MFERQILHLTFSITVSFCPLSFPSFIHLFLNEKNRTRPVCAYTVNGNTPLITALLGARYSVTLSYILISFLLSQHYAQEKNN